MNTPHDGYIKCTDCCYRAFNEIPALIQKLARQSEQLALALKIKNDHIEAQRQLKSSLMQVLERNRELNDSNAKLRVALHALQPPEPKFKNGQILVRLFDGSAFTVHAIQTNPNGVVEYTNYRGNWKGWIAETDLRAQTAQEMGQ